MTHENDYSAADEVVQYQGRHLRFGWASILIFMSLGLVLEAMHGLKIGFYLDVNNETRRFLWRLAHAHGVLTGLLNLAFAATLTMLPNLRNTLLRIASRCLIAGTVLLPGGFFLGGVRFYGGDPGAGILLSLIGAISLLVATGLTTRGTRRFGKRDD